MDKIIIKGKRLDNEFWELDFEVSGKKEIKLKKQLVPAAFLNLMIRTAIDNRNSHYQKAK